MYTEELSREQPHGWLSTMWLRLEERSSRVSGAQVVLWNHRPSPQDRLSLSLSGDSPTEFYSCLSVQQQYIVTISVECGYFWCCIESNTFIQEVENTFPLVKHAARNFVITSAASYFVQVQQIFCLAVIYPMWFFQEKLFKYIQLLSVSVHWVMLNLSTF